MKSPFAASLHLLHVVVVCPPPQHVLPERQSSVQSLHPIIIFNGKVEKSADTLKRVI